MAQPAPRPPLLAAFCRWHASCCDRSAVKRLRRRFLALVLPAVSVAALLAPASARAQDAN